MLEPGLLPAPLRIARGSRVVNNPSRGSVGSLADRRVVRKGADEESGKSFCGSDCLLLKRKVVQRAGQWQSLWRSNSEEPSGRGGQWASPCLANGPCANSSAVRALCAHPRKAIGMPSASAAPCARPGCAKRRGGYLPKCHGDTCLSIGWRLA